MSENQEKWKKQSRNQKTKTSKQTKKKNCWKDWRTSDWRSSIDRKQTSNEIVVEEETTVITNLKRT
jgi:hypothetical protein